MKPLLVFLAFCLASLSATAQQATSQPAAAQIQFRTSAVCDMCKKTLEKAMAYEKGVKAAELDIDSQTLTVVYQPDKTTPDKLRRAISLTGYDADSVQADPRAYKRLPDCCKKEMGVHHE